MINGMMLKAMNEELTAIRKEAGVANILGRIGTKVVKGVTGGLAHLGKGKGVVGELARGARTRIGTGMEAGIKRYGKAGFGRGLARGVGAATVGAGALGASALAAGGAKALRRPQPVGYQ